MSDGVYISDAAWAEFQAQDVFSTIYDFIDAMPPATAGVHTLPAEIAVQVGGYRPVAGAGYFTSPLTQTFTHPGKEDPHADNESIWRVENPNDLAKDQGMRDETDIGQHSYRDPIDHSSMPYPQGPGEFDSDYAVHNFYRKFDSSDHDLIAATIAYSDPVVIALVKHKTAMVWADITRGLDPTIVKAAQSCTVRLKRADPDEGRWTFTVASRGSGSQHTVHVKAARKAKSNQVPSSDLKMGCSCEFWKWQGPDYHASKHGYLVDHKRSNGSAPNVRDPKGVNRVCKHVYAASKTFLTYRFATNGRSASAVGPHKQGTPLMFLSARPLDRLRVRCASNKPEAIAHHIRAIASYIQDT